MLKRILTAVVFIAILFPVLYFSDTVIFAALMALCALVAVVEMLRCTGLLSHWNITVPIAAFATVFPLVPYWLDIAEVEHYAVLALILLILYFFTVMTFSREKLSLHDVSVAFATCFYIIAAFTALGILRYDVNQGKYIYLICFIGAWVTDTFAYFTGMLLGKHKLIPHVSPKKTVEGSVGGILFCVGAMLLYGLIIRSLTNGAIVANAWMLAVSGALISIVSQAGDLLMSAIKRAYGVKDYGKLFPGHGGVLDRFDSVMAVSLVLYVITSVTDLFMVA